MYCFFIPEVSFPGLFVVGNSDVTQLADPDPCTAERQGQHIQPMVLAAPGCA